MQVAPGRVVTIAYDIATEDGEIVESSELNGPVSFVHGRGAIIPGLDKRLAGMKEGDEAKLTFPPDEAFGRPEDAPRKVIKRQEFPKDAALDKGQVFDAGLPGGQRIRLEVADVSGDDVTVRMVHPLAGKTLVMNVAIRKVRDATPVEAASGAVQRSPPPPPRR
jgi:FKBP-type peptidyl-prolyl cis-trans isomerase SlyD